jgi:adenine-specific DNA-methyltransferase
MSKAERVAKTSPDLIAEQIEGLQAIFPEAFAEGKVDWDRLSATLGEVVNQRPERYSFTWAGKQDAIRALQIPSSAALIPCPEESVNWESTQHAFIEGENLEVLKLLYKAYFGRVKMIYIDPPYNTGNDFVYPDNFADPLDIYLQLTGQKDAEGNLLTSNPQTSGRYHSAWLSMMYPRLFLARQLLRDDGVIFVSIDDNEVHNLRMLMNEVFGEESFIGCLIWKRRQNVDSRAKTGLSVDHEYLLVYRRDAQGRIRGQEKDLTKYSNPDNDSRGDWLSGDLTGLATREQRPNLHYDLVNPETGIVYPCPENGWRYGKRTMARLIADERIIWPPSPTGRPRLKRYLNDLADEFTGLSSVLNTVFNLQGTRELKDLFGGKNVLDFPKPTQYLKTIVQQGAAGDEEDIVMDFFAGSCATAQAVLELSREDGGNRRYIMVQLPEPTPLGSPAREVGCETIADIGKERIRRVTKRMQEEDATRLDLPVRDTPEDIGFRVFKLAESGFRQWTPPSGDAPEAYASQMDMLADPLVDGWMPERVIWEVAVKEGFGLNCQVERLEDVRGNAVWRVTDPDKEQSFRICLDTALDPGAIRSLNLGRDDLFICRDVALDDSLAANLALQCRLKAI